MAPATLTDLPPELLDHITTYLPTANTLTNLGASSKSLHAFVEKDAWQTFARTRFPSLYPSSSSSQHKQVARSLVTLSKAWDRRALVARYIEPHGDITSHPGGQKVEKWKRPRGQTIGFTPQIDVREEVGTRWQDRKEVLVFSAGAEVCARVKKRGGSGKEEVKWMTYRPLSAYEGRDDITTLHLVKHAPDSAVDEETQRIVTGTANGDLWVLRLPEKDGGDVPISYFATQGQPVRSASLFQDAGAQPLLAANLSDSRISLYNVDSSQSKNAPISTVDIQPPQSANGQTVNHQRVWSTQFLSSSHLAAGLGPSSEPIHIYGVTPSGLSCVPVRQFSLQNDMDVMKEEITLSGFAKKTTSTIYPIVPLPPSAAGGSQQDGNVFLSGAYDGVIRLHDLRSQRQVEQAYVDPTDDSAIYSLLARGQERLVAGTSRHNLLKVFDLRLGAKCYSYLDAQPGSSMNGSHTGQSRQATRDWNLFLKPTTHSADWRGGGGGGGGGRQNWNRPRTAESSIYSLASPSPSSPFLYAGVENAVLELGFTGALDPHPDATFFRPWQPQKAGKEDAWRTKEILDLAMYDQTPDMKLHTQKSMWETWRSRQSPVAYTMEFPRVQGLDERWRVGSG